MEKKLNIPSKHKYVVSLNDDKIFVVANYWEVSSSLKFLLDNEVVAYFYKFDYWYREDMENED